MYDDELHAQQIWQKDNKLWNEKHKMEMINSICIREMNVN